MAVKPLKERERFGQLPRPAERAVLKWGRQVAELLGISEAELTMLLIATPEFAEVIGPKLDEIDSRPHAQTGRGTKLGMKARWRAVQLESVLLYRRIAGLEDVKLAWTELKADPKARLMLGLGEQVPSRPTLTRYLQRWTHRERAELYRELDRRLRQRVMQLPGMDQECRIMGMDGSQHGTHYTPPIPEIDKKGNNTGVIVNAGSVTAPSAGYVGGYHAKSGQGWQMVGLFSEHGTLLAWDISALNESEKPAAERVLKSYEREILPHRGQGTLSVLTADGGFNSHAIRQQAQAMRIVPNIHKASHKQVPGLPDEETENAAERNRRWWTFEHPKHKHYSNWKANGHGELRCICGQGKTKRVFEISPKTRRLTIATKGCCASCGNVRITAGKWSKARRPNRYVPAYRGDQADPSVGNSLTFNDPLSRIYGEDRFGFNESVHATINKRFGLLADKSWMRDISEVEAEFAIAASAISVLLLERQARSVATPEAPASGSGSAAIKQPTTLPLAA